MVFRVRAEWPGWLGFSCAAARLAVMLSQHVIVHSELVTVCEIACRHSAGRGRTVEYTAGHALVFVRRGCFVRTAEGAQAVLEPTVAFCINPGEEERYDHRQNTGDDCTVVRFDDRTAVSLWGDDRLPTGPLPMSSRIDIEHRLLVAAGRRRSDPEELAERALTLVAAHSNTTIRDG
jgi:hypothetical protein